jgi:hypothetical protein
MWFFWRNYFWLITFIMGFLLFWIFEDIIFYLTVIAVIAEFIILKSFYRLRFFMLDIIILSAYLLVCFFCLLFIFSAAVKIFLIIIGSWMCFTLFFHKIYW